MKKLPMRFDRYPYVMAEFEVPMKGYFRLVATADQSFVREYIFIEKLYRDSMGNDFWATYNKRDSGWALINDNTDRGMFEQGDILHALIRSLNIECDHRDWNE